ncbi:reverse transcriptase/maturase family protein [Botrimarina hoheduenensis]|uniref:Group II intron-encoded protein LtrA n=1 Tax=Botrimarina hoheduenensis TaxID=2528000 RepID=A0A5C5W9S7_9BACT|nr:reverse transcriptase/maturase family protein [Botrimarina hoheduenensis]TWT46789.1 Group II intron-encoded protein LtrA [Botrimarina hoheduenensis]
MKRHKRLFDRVVSAGNLLGAARDALRGKRSRRPGAEFLLDLETELFALRDELASGAYRPSPYHYFTIHEPKERLIAAAPFRDRVVHHAVVRVIQPLFESRFIEDSYASRPGKGTHAAMRRASGFAQRFRYALKCDVRRYFPSIDHQLLLGLVERVIGDRRLLELIATIVDSHHDAVDQEWPRGGDLFDVRLRKRGLPIGNLTSQFLANVYLNPLDHFVKHALRVKGYVRYLDDFLLFGDDRAELKRHSSAVQERLRSLRLVIHPDKHRLCPTELGVDFAGFVVFANGRIKLRNSTVRRYRDRYRRMRWETRHRGRETAELTQSVKAWVAHAAHAQSVGLRRAVLS